MISPRISTQLIMAETSSEIIVSRGIALHLRERTAQLYDIAFGEKLAVAIPNIADRLSVLSKSMQPEFAIGAFAGAHLVGLAGYSSAAGSLTGGINYSGLLAELGWWKGNRAAIVLALYERKAKKGELLMDGIVVDPAYRGRGIGTQLFSDLIAFAKSEHYSTVRLDVIDTNPRARKLYERLGFVEQSTEHFEFLRWRLGFGSSTTMIYTL